MMDLNKVTKQISLLELKKNTTPEEYARVLRSFGKVFFWDAAQFYVVTDHELAKEVTKNPAFSADRSSFFISRMPNLDLRLIKDFFGVVQKMMVMSDGKDHEGRRRAAAIGIDGELLDYYQPIITKTIERLIEKAAAKGKFDFVKEIAEPLPSTVLADLFCIEEEDREEFYRSSIKMTQFFGGASQYRNEDGLIVNEAAIQLREYFRGLLIKRRAEPKKDFISVLLENQKQFQLSDDEIIAQAVMMLVAGQVTTTDQLNNNMFLMMSSGVISELREKIELLPNALEEFNRLDPGVTYLFRTVKQHVRLGDAELKPEDVVFISNHAVNRDPSVFGAPDNISLDRTKNPHFAYGHGPHFCLGARLARMQMQICFKMFIEKFPQLRLDPNDPAIRNHYALSFSGFERLPLLVK